jgi:hypothetical protein
VEKMNGFRGKQCRRGYGYCAAVLGLALASATAASGQSFSFGISSGPVGYGHHHHHHHDCWPGPYFGPRWYGPSLGVLYAPPPVIQERVVYVEPRVSAVPAAPIASRTGAIASANALPVDAPVTDDRIVIRNQSGANLPVVFLVDSQDVELADGSTRTFVGKSRRTVTYDRGGRFGSTQQELAAGHYEFRITQSGWDLVRKPDVVAGSRTAVRSNSLPEERAVR